MKFLWGKIIILVGVESVRDLSYGIISQHSNISCAVIFMVQMKVIINGGGGVSGNGVVLSVFIIPRTRMFVRVLNYFH